MLNKNEKNTTNKPSNLLNKPSHKRIIILVVNSFLLLSLSGCQSASQAAESITNTNINTNTVTNSPLNTGTALLHNKRQDNITDFSANNKEAHPHAQTKDRFIATDDSASTKDGIAQVVNANNQFAIDLYKQISTQPSSTQDNIFFSPYIIKRIL